LIAAALIVQVFLTGDRQFACSVAASFDCTSVLNSTPAPASAHDGLQIIEPEVWRRTVRLKPDAQAKTQAVLAATPGPVVTHQPRATSPHAPNKVASNQARPFRSRAPPLSAAAA
jgi:hypothetical protein